MTLQNHAGDRSYSFSSLFIKHFTTGPQFEFVADTAKNAFLFMVIAAIAIGLNLSVHYFNELKVDVFFIWGLKALEYLLFVCDFLWFVTFLIITTYRTLRAFVKENSI